MAQSTNLITAEEFIAQGTTWGQLASIIRWHKFRMGAHNITPDDIERHKQVIRKIRKILKTYPRRK